MYTSAALRWGIQIKAKKLNTTDSDRNPAVMMITAQDAGCCGDVGKLFCSNGVDLARRVYDLAEL
jgi:hypothetical protein